MTRTRQIIMPAMMIVLVVILIGNVVLKWVE